LGAGLSGEMGQEASNGNSRKRECFYEAASGRNGVGGVLAGRRPAPLPSRRAKKNIRGNLSKEEEKREPRKERPILKKKREKKAPYFKVTAEKRRDPFSFVRKKGERKERKKKTHKKENCFFVNKDVIPPLQ